MAHTLPVLLHLYSTKRFTTTHIDPALQLHRFCVSLQDESKRTETICKMHCHTPEEHQNHFEEIYSFLVQYVTKSGF